MHLDRKDLITASFFTPKNKKIEKNLLNPIFIPTFAPEKLKMII